MKYRLFIAKRNGRWALFTYGWPRNGKPTPKKRPFRTFTTYEGAMHSACARLKRNAIQQREERGYFSGSTT